MTLLENSTAEPSLPRPARPRRPDFLRAFRFLLPRPRPAERLARFRPKVRFRLEKNDYLVKTAETPAEVEAALRLRWEVFGREWRRETRDGWDMDAFDFRCDHLLILDRAAGRVLGTYRLMCSLFDRRYYSMTEFGLGRFARTEGTKVELGRACVDRSHRTGLTLALLWKGVRHYYETVGARYLFGCSSVHTTDHGAIQRLATWFRRQGYVDESWAIRPRLARRFPGLGRGPEALSPAESDAARDLVPPLLLSYLKAGAIVAPEPALDRAFGCVDFLTVLDTRLLTAPYDRKTTA